MRIRNTAADGSILGLLLTAYRAKCRLGAQCLMLTVLVPIADVITVAIANNAYGAKSQLSSLLAS